MKSLPSDRSILFVGALMGSAILAVSIFNLLPIPETVKGSDAVNWLIALLGGAIGAALVKRKLVRSHR